MEQNEQYENLKKHIDQLQNKIFLSSIKDSSLIAELEIAQKELKNLKKSLKLKSF